MTYNYRRFRHTHYDLASFPGPGAGQPMPELTLFTLDGEAVQTSDFRGRMLVLETASVTCPMYAKSVPAMTALAAAHPDVSFVLMYVREAHPGRRLGAHQTRAEKSAAARSVPDRWRDPRRVLVDDVDGRAHRALGALPNMVYIVDAVGTIVFRGDWNRAEVVASILDGSATPDLRNREHFPPAKPNPVVAVRALGFGGWDAVADFVLGLPGLLRQHWRAGRRASERRRTGESKP